MKHEIYTKQTTIPAPVEALFAYHEREGAFMRLNPPWEPVEILEHTGGIQDGARVRLKLRIGPVPQTWSLTHQNYIPNQQFEDRQLEGPFAHWVHTHRMHRIDDRTSAIEDHIAYKLPLGMLGKIGGGEFARAKTERMFKYRHEVTRRDLQTHMRYQERPRLTVAISGASGLIGSQLAPFLTTGGHSVKKMVRAPEQVGENRFLFDIANGRLNPDDLAGVDAVVHLAGESIADKRWTDEQKREILDSRIKGTRLLAETLAALPNKPCVLISASGIGYYGEHGGDILDEASPSGKQFQSEVCRAWEAALQPAIDAGIRVVILRFGIVLSMAGGALKRMLLPYQLGVGGKLGSGNQYMSWVALDDVLDIIYYALMNDDLAGVVNATAPRPVTNAEFTRILGKVLNRPTVFPVPSFGLRLLFGKVADELLLSSIRVEPRALQKRDYTFRYPELEAALRHLLGKVK